MIASRRFLPPISALVAFEAIDRLGSATAAAEELSLTQSAVSRQLKTLEEQLGADLIRRERNRLVLTPAGQDYAREVREVLRRLGQASIRVSTRPEGGSIDLAILPGYGMHRLAPRLNEFVRSHPDVTVESDHKDAAFDFRRRSFDAAIHYGRRDWRGVEYLLLEEERVLPVCAPGFLGEMPLQSAEALFDHPLLHIESRPNAWTHWAEAHGLNGRAPAGMVFDQFSTMAEAAAHGLGVALLPDFLVQHDLDLGRLVAAFGAPVQSVGAYYLVWPTDRDSYLPLRRFRNWLGDQLASDTAGQSG